MLRQIAPLLLAALPLMALAQEQDSPPIDPDALAAVLDTITDPSETANEIAQQVTACLRPLYTDELRHDPIVFSVDFDAEGKPNPPEMVEPEMSDAERPHLRQLIRAEAALFDCAPLTVGGLPVSNVTLTFRAEADSVTLFGEEETPEDDTPMALGREERRQIQIRLRLAGFDPGGADGVFGPRSREAIGEWQSAAGYQPTGVLTTSQVARLINETDTAYAEWNARQPRQAAPTRGNQKYYRDRDGCLRYANGKIVPNQSIKCDVKGMFTF